MLLYIGLRLVYEQTSWAKRKKARIMESEARIQEGLKQVLKEAGQSTGRAPSPGSPGKDPKLGAKEV